MEKYYYKQIIIIGNSPECFVVNHEIQSNNLKQITEEEFIA